MRKAPPSMTTTGLAIIQRCSRSRWRRVTCPVVGEQRPQFVDEQGKSLQARFSTTWWKNILAAVRYKFVSVFLPDGYPTTVHPYYVSFSAWNMLQVIMGSAVGVLSTQSLLYGLGLSSGGGSMALSSTINWILKDGLGQLGGVAVVSWLGGRFDVETRKLRLLAACLLNVSCWLEVLVPLAPSHFILTAAFANVLKNVSWMTTSATRAPILRNQGAGRDNLGDLTGKAASQTTLGATIGTGLGVLLSTAFLAASEASATPPENAIRCLAIVAPLSLISLLATYRSCLSAVSPRLNLARLEIIYYQCFAELFAGKTFIQPRVEVLSALHRYIMPPETMCVREPIFANNIARLTGSMSSVRLLIEPPLTVTQARFLEPDSPYWIYLKSGPVPVISLWFSANDAPPGENVVFKALLEALLYKYFLGRGQSITREKMRELADSLSDPLREALQCRGWIVDDKQLYSGPRHPLKFIV